ncbi:FtsX-like permease family protein [Thalassospiraceae bacterium LMO-JJ14]|nr:FtsX-like permease family protein [Thalassospiraceae bacterium LMO-JJ14]
MSGKLSLSLAWRIAGRELRGGLAGFRVFMLCLSLGVAAITAVGWTSNAVVGGLEADARKLLGGDMEMRLVHRAAGPDERAWLAANSTKLSETIRLRAMASTADNASRTLVELKAVDDVYPLVGEMELAPALPREAMFAGKGGLPGALVDANLLSKLGIAEGGILKIGKAQFHVGAVIKSEPDRVTSVINYGPRVMIAKADLDATGLVQPGSLIRYYYRILFEAGIDPTSWRAALTDAFPDAGWRVRAANEAAPGVRRFIERLTLFMGFVGYTVLLVGGVGIARAVSAYLESKSRTIATLKCLGAPAGLIVQVYLLQVLALSGLAVSVGLLAGVILPALSLYAIADLLPVRPVLGWHAEALVIAAAFGLLTAITAALWPLGRAREVPARDLFRAQAEPLAATPRRIYLLWIGIGIALLIGLVFLSATDKWFALWFVLGALATVALLRLAGIILIRLSRQLHPKNAMARLVIANMHRPGAATSGVILSLGLGLAVLVAVVQIEGNITRQIDERLPKEAPAYFFIDIQPGQVADFDRIVSGVEGTSDLRREPVVRGRIVEINGTPVNEAAIAPESQWAVRGDRALTSAAAKKPDMDIVAGAWWPADYTGPPLISLDDGLAKGFGVGLGDTLTLNILGRRITAKIASLRDIDWQSLRFDFAVVLSPGVLEGAPHTHIAAVRASEAAEAPLEKAVTDAFDNVSAIHVREALAAARDLMAGISIAIRAVAGLTVIAGAIVLAGALAAGQQRRRFDAVVFKVLGATRKRIALAFVLEYGALGIITALCAFAVGTLAAWAVTAFLMHLDWTWLAREALATLTLALSATIVLGLAGSWRILGLKTAPYLRND